MRDSSAPGPREAPYGTWASPVTPDLITTQTVRLGGLMADGGTLYWIEGRPTENGRRLVMREYPGTATGAAEVTPSHVNVCSRVHEYGGGAAVVANGMLYYVNFSDQRLYAQHGRRAAAISPPGTARYADMTLDRRHSRLIAVCEHHGNHGEPANVLAAVAWDGSQRTTVLASAHDFVAYPRVSPDGTELAWIAWDHPNMPWDGTLLKRARLAADGGLVEVRRVAGDSRTSVLQPQWGPDGSLYFISDSSGWWNLYRDGGAAARPQALCPMAADFARPLWQLGDRTYAVLDSQRLACTYRAEGAWHLAVLDGATGRLSRVATAYTDFADLVATGAGVAAVAAGPATLPAVVRFDLHGGETVVRRSGEPHLDSAAISLPRPVAFPTGPRPEQGTETAYGLYYPPTNPAYCGPAEAAPPLIVRCHGGPTGAFAGTLALGVQYWTSRGFAVMEVDYRGSSGYGRAYRDRLLENWGVVDVEDCVAAAEWLCRRGLADPRRLAIAGGSAGGYTALAALTFTGTFRAGASHYGVSDLEALRAETHKFESRYLDRLVGPYPESQARYRARSPLHHADRLACPVIFFQGQADRVVPPNQAERMVAALKTKGLPVAYLAFEDEAHGFRQAATIKRTLVAELDFYARIFGFQPADTITPVPIMNLD